MHSVTTDWLLGCDTLYTSSLGPKLLNILRHTHTHTRSTALFPGLPGWAGTRKVKPIWILLKQETVSGSDISWAIWKSAPRFRQITTPAPHQSVFYRPDALPAAQPTASKHWRQYLTTVLRQCQSYSRLTTDIWFTKHVTKDAKLFLGMIHLQSLRSSETVVIQ